MYENSGLQYRWRVTASEVRSALYDGRINPDAAFRTVLRGALLIISSAISSCRGTLPVARGPAGRAPTSTHWHLHQTISTAAVSVVLRRENKHHTRSTATIYDGAATNELTLLIKLIKHTQTMSAPPVSFKRLLATDINRQRPRELNWDRLWTCG